MRTNDAPLRYAVLRHEGVDEPHFDLLFEPGPGEPLITFRSDRWPITERVQVQRLPDHRPVYLEYEGPISGNRGRVRRIEAGTYQCSAPWEAFEQTMQLVLFPHNQRLAIERVGAELWIGPASTAP